MRQFRIRPTVLDDGTPAWTLIADWEMAGFAAGSKTMATNVDRSVLEKAIAHLEQRDADQPGAVQYSGLSTNREQGSEVNKSNGQ